MALTMYEKLFKRHEKPNPYPGEVYLNNALRLLLKCDLDDPKIVNAISEIGFCFQKYGWSIQEDNRKKLAEEGLLFTIPKNPCNDCIESAFSTICKCEDKARFDADRTTNNVWIHREEMDFKDEKGVEHWHGMCPNCGFVHDFIDGHIGQYNYCPQCGLHLGE